MYIKVFARVAILAIVTTFYAQFRPAAATPFEWNRLGRLAGETGAEPYVSAIATHPTDPDVVTVGVLLTTEETALVYHSEDGGATWQPRSAGLPAGLPPYAGVNDLIALPGSPDVLYAGLDQGLWTSDDGGQNWVTAAGGSLAADERIIALDATAGVNTTVYALTPAGVYASVNGAPWVKRSSGLPAADANIYNDLAVHPTAPGTVFVATNPSGVYRSTNSGVGWSAVNNSLPAGTRNTRAVAVAPSGDVFISLRGAGLYRSSNNGNSWTLSHEGITYETTLYGSVEKPAFSPVDPDLAYVYNSDGVFQSEDGGESWSPAPGGFSGSVLVSALAFHEARPQEFLAGTASSGVWQLATLVGRVFVPAAVR